MDELIDIFDKNQVFLKKELKSVAHSLGLWHKAVHCYLINDKNEIVIQKRSANKDLYPSFWDISFAGHVGAGEDTRISAIRECKEELGITLHENEIKYLFTICESLHFNKINNNEFVDVFLCKKNFEKIIKQDEEVDEIKLIKITEFIDMIEKKEPSLIPHYDEYKKIVPVLKKYCT